MKKDELIRILLFALLLTGSVNCKKFLDEKSDPNDIIPSKLDELQTLLNNASEVMNSLSTGGYCELVSDNIFVKTSAWQQFASISAPVFQADTKNYIWDDQSHDNYWSQPYTGPIHYANIVKDQLEILGPGEDEEKYKSLYGSALFYRSFAFLGLAQLYCRPYATEYFNHPGIVLRDNSNVSEKKPRSTVAQTYDRIIADLKHAAQLLPATTRFATQPTKLAAWAALARTYLFMRLYEEAGKYADSVLQNYHALIDFNSLSATGHPPIKSLNPEVIFHSFSPQYIILYNHRIDSVLYDSYHANDLRKTIYFSPNTGADAGTFSFQGSYSGDVEPKSLFDGLTTGEMYLVRAECSARAGDKEAALADLNTLLEKRWKQGTWSPVYALSADEALSKILVERRKELVYRGLRWPDIRRFNLERKDITLRRMIGADPQTLSPNELRTVMMIPQIEIDNNPAVVPNPR